MSAIEMTPTRDSYFELVRKFPLKPIRSDDELNLAVEVINGLLDRPTLDPDEEAYLDVLSDLVERYESEAHPMPPLPDSAMLRHLIEAKEVSQAEVAREAGIPESTVSEVLAGKRSLSRPNIGRLARYFRIDPGVFNFD